MKIVPVNQFVERTIAKKNLDTIGDPMQIVAQVNYSAFTNVIKNIIMFVFRCIKSFNLFQQSLALNKHLSAINAVPNQIHAWQERAIVVQIMIVPLTQFVEKIIAKPNLDTIGHPMQSVALVINFRHYTFHENKTLLNRIKVLQCLNILDSYLLSVGVDISLWAIQIKTIVKNGKIQLLHDSGNSL